MFTHKFFLYNVVKSHRPVSSSPFLAQIQLFSLRLRALLSRQCV